METENQMEPTKDITAGVKIATHGTASVETDTSQSSCVEEMEQGGGKDMEQEGGKETVQEGVKETVQEGVKETVQEGVKETVQEGVKETVQEGVKETVQEGVKETVQEGVKETVQEGVKETVQEGGKEIEHEGEEVSVELCTEIQEEVEQSKEEMSDMNEEADKEDSPKCGGGSEHVGESNGADPFHYTKRDAFTSEIYKIEIFNLPWFGYRQLKKRLATLDVNPVKIKAVEKRGFAFATFRNEEERDLAMEKISGHVWKDRKLKVKKASATADPMLKRKQDRGQGNEPVQKKGRDENSTDSGLPPDIRLKNAVSPLWSMPYEEQLQLKTGDMVEVLKTLADHIYRDNKDFQVWVKSQRKEYDGKCCELLPIISSPVTESYRNKCEFTVGKDINGKDNVVGFRYGLYKDGSASVGEPGVLTNIPETMKTVTKSFQEFLQASQYGAFDPSSHGGHWRQLTVRSCRGSQDMMAIADFHPQQLSQEEIDAEKDRLRDYFSSGAGTTCGVTSLYFHSNAERMPLSESYVHIYGEKYITEELLGMKFRISPSAFFQVNTAAAELLYSQIVEWCNVSSDTTVLDICCGTGTIGLTVAKKVSRVVGIEMCEEAVTDAKANAKLNEVDNVQYISSKAEAAIKKTMKSIRSQDVVAIVDPPRAGLNSTVFQALRRSPHLTKIVFVSCNPKAAMNNFRDLTRAPSRRNKGPPYKPVRAIPVDMFPQTRHCELVVMFERDKPYSDPYDSPSSP